VIAALDGAVAAIHSEGRPGRAALLRQHRLVPGVGHGRLDVINFDAYEYFQGLSLYPAELDAFLRRAAPELGHRAPFALRRRPGPADLAGRAGRSHRTTGIQGHRPRPALPAGAPHAFLRSGDGDRREGGPPRWTRWSNCRAWFGNGKGSHDRRRHRQGRRGEDHRRFPDPAAPAGVGRDSRAGHRCRPVQLPGPRRWGSPSGGRWPTCARSCAPARAGRPPCPPPSGSPCRPKRPWWRTPGFDLLTMGRPEGKGCYCFVNNLIRDHLDRLARSYRHVLVDCEAGLEHLSRRTSGRPGRAGLRGQPLAHGGGDRTALAGPLWGPARRPSARADLVLNQCERSRPAPRALSFRQVFMVPPDPEVASSIPPEARC
jgi:hypothetical protein